MKKVVVCFLLLAILSVTAIQLGCNSGDISVEKKAGTEKITLKAEGEEYNNGLQFKFDGEEKGFELVSNISSGMHDSTSCSDCGYVEYNGKKAYHICNHDRGQNGFLFKFTSSVKADYFAGATIEYMTSKKTEESQILILKADAQNIKSPVNSETLINEGSDEWDRINIEIDDLSNIADDNGFFEGFHFVVKSNDTVDFYLTEINLKIDAEKICNPDLPQTVFYEKGAVETLANKIKSNFEDSNLSAEIMVDCVSYLQNTTKDDGEIIYDVEVTMTNGKFFAFPSITKIIPSLKDSWLEDSKSIYGATQKLAKGWEKKFSDSGILTLENHEISCAEGIKKMQYAVISPEKKFTDEDVKWHDVQKLILNKNGIKFMYINSFLDYGKELQNGQNYKMIVRGVTNNNNFIKHIEKSFTYKEYSAEKNRAIEAAYEKIKTMELCGENNDAKENYIKNKIEKSINDSKIAVVVKKTATGGSSSFFDISVTYSDKEAKTCSGDAFKIKDFKVWHNEQDLNKSIKLISPCDAQKDIVLATEYIIDLSNASYDSFTDVSYAYLRGEYCTPPAVKLQWSNDGKELSSYKIYISESYNFEECFEFETDQLFYEVYNLKVGAKYYWKVVSENIESAVFSFETKAGYPRFIKADGVSNMRDIGGYLTQDGKIIKQGLVFRAGSLDKISKSSKESLAYQLKIKTDLDLRGKTNAVSPLGKEVNYIPKAVKWYHGIFDEEPKKLMAETIKLFADEKNYPINFHCSLGRDRTGTLSMLLLGVLGVDEETIIREYHYSFFSENGLYSVSEFSALQENLTAFKSHLNNYGGKTDSFNKRVEAFLLDIGVTSEEINKIRTILLEDAPINEEINDSIVFEENTIFTPVFYIILTVSILTVTAVILFIIVLKKRRAHFGKNS